jgi:RNAse (barnase) inhibitor barstar
MARTLSEFHYSTLFIEGSAFADAERFHDEMAFKLGLPSWYGRNLDALLDCLSSIGDPQNNLCRHWEWREEKRLVLRILGLSIDNVDVAVAAAFVQTVADVNERLEQDGATNRIWIEYTSADLDRA